MVQSNPGLKSLTSCGVLAIFETFEMSKRISVIQGMLDDRKSIREMSSRNESAMQLIPLHIMEVLHTVGILLPSNI